MNRYVLVGDLQECRIDLFRTHARLRASIAVNHQVISLSYFANRKWHKDKYDKLCAMIHAIHPRISGFVYANGEEYYPLVAMGKPSRLISSGNINEWKDYIYYNAQYIDFVANSDDNFSIEVDGQWVDDAHLLNMVDDMPRLFTLPKPPNANGICRLQLGYDAGYDVRDGAVYTHGNGLWVKSYVETNSAYSKGEIDKAMLEWSIMSE